MAVIAKAEITVSWIVDIEKTITYYLLQSSTAAAPHKPTTNPPGGNWQTTEPSYISGSTNTLYFVDLTIMTDATYFYSEVSKSSSYEAAKAAYNKAEAAAKTATNYMKYTAADGLVVGNMSDTTLKRNVQIVSDAVNVRNGSTILASYSDDKICLGKNSKKSTIDLCDGSAQMSYVSDSVTGLPYFELKSGENIRLSAVYTESDGRLAGTGLSIRSIGRDGDTDYADSHWQISSNIQDGDNSSLAMASGEAGVVWLYAIEKGEAQLKVDGTKSTIEMIGKVTIRDSDIDTVGCTITGGVATLKDIQTQSISSLNDFVTPKQYSYTNNGITTTVWESPLAIRIKATGAASVELGTKSGYATIGYVKMTNIAKIIKKVMLHGYYTGTFRINYDSNKIQFGITLKNGVAANYEKDTQVFIDETFLFI